MKKTYCIMFGILAVTGCATNVPVRNGTTEKQQEVRQTAPPVLPGGLSTPKNERKAQAALENYNNGTSIDLVTEGGMRSKIVLGEWEESPSSGQWCRIFAVENDVRYACRLAKEDWRLSERVVPPQARTEPTQPAPLPVAPPIEEEHVEEIERQKLEKRKQQAAVVLEERRRKEKSRKPFFSILGIGDL